jgi:nitroreductase
MTLVEVLKYRRSVRHFKSDSVPEESIKFILEVARTSPSAGGLHSYEVIVTQEKVGPYDAPIYIVVCAMPERAAARYGDRGRNLYAIQDATIFASYIQLLAVDMGLATVWVGAFREDKVKKMLNIADDWQPVVILPMGYECQT